MNLYQHLAHEERYMIYQHLKKDYTIQSIASRLDRSPSTISREIRRNKGKRGYRLNKHMEWLVSFLKQLTDQF